MRSRQSAIPLRLSQSAAETPDMDVGRRLALGVSVSTDGRRLHSGLFSAVGRGLQLELNPVASASEPLPDAIAQSYAQLAAGCADAALVPQLGRRLAALIATVVHQWAARAGPQRDRLLLIGLHEPGWWAIEGGTPSCATVCDTAEVAESTGLSVIDAFAARDLAQQGRGGPLSAAPLWLLLADRHAAEDGPARLLLELGGTTRLTLLPPSTRADRLPELTAFDVGPGTAMLDRLTHRLTEGKQSIDEGGRLAVQGQRIDELWQHCREHPLCQRPPGWQPYGVSPEPLLEIAYRLAQQQRWSVQDVLCTATHWIAKRVATIVANHLPSQPRVSEVIVSGGGRQNGLLLRQIKQRLPHLRMRLIDQFGFDDAALKSGVAATLALLHVDHTPANVTSVTGTQVPRVLGRLTPGSPATWHRLLTEMSAHKPTLLPLRAAV